MTLKGQIKKILADLPTLLSKGRRAVRSHNTTIAITLAAVEAAYESLKDRYRTLSGHDFVPDLPQGQAQRLPQASQPQNVSANHQNPGYPRSSMQSQESDIVFRRASDDSDTYQAPRYSMPGNTYRTTPSNTYQSPAHLHAPAGPGRGYSSPHLPLPTSAGSQHPSMYSQHTSQRPAQYAAAPYGQPQGYHGVPGLYAQQQPSTASVGTVYPGQPQQHMYGYGSGAYTPTKAAASAATLYNAQQQQNQQYYQNPYYPSGQQ
ncbi:hypothetical protein BDZ89DRAFT_1072989 [Hymenopellis radicata]|nr:hypothetical protein BDZ89DRAFT_1072989 [Hymenopellis radicata]